MQQSSSILSKKKIALGLAAIILIIVFYWAYSSSLVSITVENPGAGGGFSYSFLDQSTGKNITLQSSEAKLKARLPKGTYEVSVDHGVNNYFQIVTTKRFLVTSHIDAQLKSQAGREYVGNNPGSCMELIQQVLVSYSCGDLYQNVNQHVQASASTPTYTTRRTDTAVNGYLQGFLHFQDKALALIQNLPAGETNAYYSLDEVDSTLSLRSSIRLAGIDGTKSYSAAAYRDGFILYNPTFSEVYYFASPAAQPQAVKLTRPADKQLRPISLSSDDGQIVVLFSTALDNPADGVKLSSEVTMTSPASSQDFKFTGGYSSAQSCGAAKLCLFGHGAMEVYDISGSLPKKQATLKGARQALNNGNSLLVVNGRGILNISADFQKGYYEYKFGDFKFNGIQATNGGYVLSLTNNRSHRVALYVDEGSSSTGNIDQQVEQLLKKPEIDDISAYGSYIFASPVLGAQTYQPSTGSYDYDSATKNRVNNQINLDVKAIGIDTSKYKVINPYAE